MGSALRSCPGRADVGCGIALDQPRRTTSPCASPSVSIRRASRMDSSRLERGALHRTVRTIPCRATVRAHAAPSVRNREKRDDGRRPGMGARAIRAVRLRPYPVRQADRQEPGDPAATRADGRRRGRRAHGGHGGLRRRTECGTVRDCAGHALQRRGGQDPHGGESATRATSIAHQVHGAIGFTYEHHLNYATRRLWSWREACGADAWWAERLGRAAIEARAAGFWPSITRKQFSLRCRRALEQLKGDNTMSETTSSGRKRPSPVKAMWPSWKSSGRRTISSTSSW